MWRFLSKGLFDGRESVRRLRHLQQLGFRLGYRLLPRPLRLARLHLQQRLQHLQWPHLSPWHEITLLTMLPSMLLTFNQIRKT